jgi:uncharacterized protein YjdB
MKPSRLAVTSWLFFGVLAALGCGRSGLRLGDGGARDGGGILDGARLDGSGDGRLPDGGLPTDGARPLDGGSDAGPVALVGLGVTPALRTAGMGTRVNFSATGRYSDGSTRDLTGAATWTSSSQMVAVVMGGVATTRSAGMATITAASGGFTGSATLTVTAAALARLTIDPPDLIVPVGMKGTLRATGLYSDGTSQDLTGQATWMSGDPGVASVAGGVVTGLRAGVAGVSATFQMAAAKVAVTVTNAKLVSLQISPSGATLPLPGMQQFTAIAIYDDGSKSDVTSQAMWTSSDERILALSTNPGEVGLFRARSPGGVAVSASVNGVSAATMVLVTAARLVAIRVMPDSAVTPRGTTQSFVARGVYSDGSGGDITASVSWSSMDERVATVSNSPGSQGVVTGLNAGGTLIIASLAGVTGQAKLAVTEAKITGFSITPRMVTVGINAVQPLMGTATFSDGSSKDVTADASWMISDPGVASVGNGPGMAGQVTGLSVGNAVVVGSYGGLAEKITVTVTSATLTGITVNPPSLDLSAGATGTFTATGSYSDGSTLDITAQVTWTADDAKVAAVSNAGGTSGLVTALGPGVTKVHAQLGGQQGTGLVTVTAAKGLISVSPVAASRRVGQNLQFSASFIRTDGTSMNVTGMAMWSSSDPMVASLGGGMGPGAASRATCQSEGTATISATYMGLSDSTVLTCTPLPKLVDLQVTPFAADLSVGQSQPFIATALFSDGSTQNVTNQTAWSSSDAMVATVRNMGGGGGGRGLTTAVGAGTAAITGVYMGLTATASLTVTAAGMLTGISVSPPLVSLRVGEMQGLQATALFSDGSTRNVTGMTTWQSSDQTVADVSNAGGGMGGGTRGQVTGLAAGSVTITATYMGLTSTASVTVTAATLLSVQVTPANATMPKGNTQQYQAVGLYSDGSTRMLTNQATWASSTAAAAVSNAGNSRGQVTALAAGPTDISATVGAVSGKTPLTVTAATVTEVQVTPTNPSIPLGVTQPLQATAIYSDFSTQNVTGQATWTSSNGMVAQVSNAGGSRGQATGLAAGTSTISATFMNVIGQTVLTVSSATIKEIQLSPSAVSSPVGVTIRFDATAILTDNSSRNITATATWTSSDDTVVSISTANGTRGLATALAAGTVTIKASAGGVSGTTSYTVGAQTLSTISVDPAPLTLMLGDTESFSATGQYSDGSTYDLTDSVTWISTKSGVATVSNANASRGLVTSVSAGTTTIEAHFQGRTGTSDVTVTP